MGRNFGGSSASDGSGSGWERASAFAGIAVIGAGVWVCGLLATAILRAVQGIPSSEAVTRREVRRHLNRQAPREPGISVEDVRAYMQRHAEVAEGLFNGQLPQPPAADIDRRTGEIKPPPMPSRPGVHNPEDQWAQAEAARRRHELEEADLDKPSIG